MNGLFASRGFNLGIEAGNFNRDVGLGLDSTLTFNGETEGLDIDGLGTRNFDFDVVVGRNGLVVDLFNDRAVGALDVALDDRDGDELFVDLRLNDSLHTSALVGDGSRSRDAGRKSDGRSLDNRGLLLGSDDRGAVDGVRAIVVQGNLVNVAVNSFGGLGSLRSREVEGRESASFGSGQVDGGESGRNNDRGVGDNSGTAGHARRGAGEAERLGVVIASLKKKVKFRLK